MVHPVNPVVLICISIKGTGDHVERSEAVKRITEILSESKIGVLSTSHNNEPNARYMWFYNDGLTLYAKTNDASPKYDELKDNPKAHILRSEEHTSELQSRFDLVCRLLLEKKK